MDQDQNPVREIACTGIFLATPAYGPMIYPFYDSMRETCRWLAENGVPYTLGITPGNSLVQLARNSLVAAFMATSCSHLMFIDSDISWEPQAVTRLLALDEDMVCGAYPRKSYPIEFLFNVAPRPDGSIARNPQTGAIEVVHAATGFLMIRRRVFERMFEAYPRTKYTNRNAGPEVQPFTYALFDCEVRDGEFWGEDFTFSHRFRALGPDCRIWMDPSIRLKHWGLHAFEGDPASLFREAP